MLTQTEIDTIERNRHELALADHVDVDLPDEFFYGAVDGLVADGEPEPDYAAAARAAYRAWGDDCRDYHEGRGDYLYDLAGDR